MNEAVAPSVRPQAPLLNPERVAYWYLRLNGFLQIENFVVHPPHHGGQRTDADLLGVRFPYRAERLIDDPDDLMEDDLEKLRLSQDRIDIVISEIKTGRCALNGPWTDQERQNIHRVIAAIGSLPTEMVEPAANALYETAQFDQTDHPRIRLVLFGREQDDGLAGKYAGITQVKWAEALTFIWNRFDRYRRQKTQVDQWDESGRCLKALAGRHNRDDFIAEACKLMGVQAAKAA